MHLVQVVLTDAEDEGYRELVGPPMRRESAELAVSLYREDTENLRQSLTISIVPVPEFGTCVGAR